MAGKEFVGENSIGGAMLTSAAVVGRFVPVDGGGLRLKVSDTKGEELTVARDFSSRRCVAAFLVRGVLFQRVVFQRRMDFRRRSRRHRGARR